MIFNLELSKRLAAKGILISYVSTPKNLQRLPLIPSKLQNKINLLEIQLPRVEGLPENCEATIDLQLNQIQFLKKAYDKLAQPFENLMQKVVPDLILFDFAPYWIPEIGAKFGVPTVFFSVYTAAAMAFIGPPDELRTGNRRPSPEHFTMSPDWIPFPSLIATRPDYATRMWTSLNFPDASGVSSGQRLAKSIEDCSFVAFRSCDEFEGEYIKVVRELYQKPVLPIGVLPPVPFVWILRKPQDVDSSDLLPPGFANRTSSQGIVIQGWVPQLEILAHSAIGGCLFHSGWGTIVESLGFGHPLILLPMIADQGFNAKLLVEKEVGYEVPRNEDGSFSREIVASSIRISGFCSWFQTKSGWVVTITDDKSNTSDLAVEHEIFQLHLVLHLKDSKATVSAIAQLQFDSVLHPHSLHYQHPVQCHFAISLSTSKFSKS